MEREADERREAAIASSAALRPNLKLKNGVTDAHLSKFKELHRRRLQIKAKSKAINRPKGSVDGKGKSKSQRKGNVATTLPVPDEGASQAVENNTSTKISPNQVKDVTSLAEHPKKRQKLHWGLDTKERWEQEYGNLIEGMASRAHKIVQCFKDHILQQ